MILHRNTQKEGMKFYRQTTWHATSLRVATHTGYTKY